MEVAEYDDSMEALPVEEHVTSTSDDREELRGKKYQDPNKGKQGFKTRTRH